PSFFASLMPLSFLSVAGSATGFPAATSALAVGHLCELALETRSAWAHGRRLQRLPFLPLDPLLDHHRAVTVVVVEHLAVQALDAFVGIDHPLGMDRLDGAFVPAALAGRAAFLVALQPIEHADAGRNGKRAAQGAEIAAVEPFDDEPGRQHGEREQ